MNDTLLERVQADVLAVLLAVPGLATVNILADNEGDIEAKILRGLGTLSDGRGKIGLVVVVMLPEVMTMEKNLPGPVMDVQVEIQIIEQPLLNREATKGTLIRSSQAALRTLAALHLRSLGDVTLYGEKNPVKPLKVKKGYVSHVVTLNLADTGMATAAKPLGVAAVMVDGAGYLMVTGALTSGGEPFSFPALPPGPPLNGKPYFEDEVTGCISYYEDGYFYLKGVDGANEPLWRSSQNTGVASPELATGWEYLGVSGAGGIPTLSLGGGILTLSCDSPASSIRYTTDGTFPSETAGTLYTTPIGGLETGTVVRAAAYVADQAPGDVLELTVTA